MVKFEEANTRLFKNIYVCRKCKSKIRAHSMKVIRGQAVCRKCASKALRPKKKK
ncbi:50S ribosomal protein L40e [Candidatus Woesearchaeota archaeon]|nr:50S ribosomal protein L40e [Candidatus Woesearchaeota archaeon]